MPDWCVAVKKAMIDHDDMTVTELAKETGFCSLAYQPSRQWCAGAVRERPGRNRKVPEHQRGWRTGANLHLKYTRKDGVKKVAIKTPEYLQKSARKSA